MMFKGSIFLVVLFSFIFTSHTSAQASVIHDTLKDVKSYKIYYGEANDQVIQELSEYDMVVIEPYAFTKEQIQSLQQAGTLVLGYVSVLELESWHKSQVLETDYYYRNNKKMKIPQWNTYIMDIGEDHYQDIILTKVKQQIVGKGMDGVFLDTAGDIDDYFHKQPDVQKYFREAYVDLLKEMKQIDSNLIFVQNWGFDTIKSASLNYIHAVLWEDFNKQVVATNEWSQNWIRYFKQQSDNIVTFTVVPDGPSEKYSLKQGFIPTRNPNDIYDH